MSKYLFETNEFGLSDGGIHLLRSRFNYKTINYDQIELLTFEKGKQLNNWLLIFFIGFILVSFSLYFSFRLSYVIYNNELHSFYVEEFIVPVLPLMLGVYCLYSSTRNSLVVKVRTIQNKVTKLALKQIEIANQFSEFESFLREKLKTRVQSEI